MEERVGAERLRLMKAVHKGKITYEQYDDLVATLKREAEAKLRADSNAIYASVLRLAERCA